MELAIAFVGRGVRGLGVRPQERRAVGLLALIFGLGEAGRGLGMNASDALFFVRFGVERLPWMYMGLGALTFLAVLLYAAGLSRFQWRLLHPLYWVVALLLILERFLIPLGFEAIYPALWLSVQVFSWVLVTAGWGLASQSFDTRQAKRLFSLFASASILGSIVGNAATGPLANWIGTENLFLIYALILLAAYRAVRSLTKGLPQEREGTSEGGALGDLLLGVRVLRRSRLLQLIFAASVLFSVLFFSVWFPFNKTVSATFATESELAGFLGSFTSIVMASTLLLSLLSNRIYARSGIVNVILLVPLIYLAGFGLWLIQFSLVTAIALRFAHMVWINGAGWTAWNALFNVYRGDRREQLRAFESGVPSQIGTSLSGLLLLLGDRVLSNQQIFLLGASAALVCALLCWRMRSAYGQALLEAIRSGLVDVFTGSPEALGRLGADAQARRTALTALEDPNPSVRRIGAHLLGRMGQLQAVDPLIESLTDGAAPVRRAALDSLRMLGDGRAAEAVRPLLGDQAAGVRQASVRTLAALGVAGDGWLEAASRDEDPAVRAEAAAQLSMRGELAIGSQQLSELLNSGGRDEVLAALQVANELGIELPLSDLRRLVVHSAAAVRQQAVASLGAHQGGTSQRLILEAMGDDDERVRLAAAAAAQRSTIDSQVLIERLREADADAQRAVLVALDGSDDWTRQELISWTLAQMKELNGLLAAGARLDGQMADDGEAELALLYDLVVRRQSERTELILQALEKLAPSGTLQLVARGLTSEKRALRTRALEALDTLGEHRIVRGFLPLLEREPGEANLPSLDQVLADLSQDRDPWMRAFALSLRAARLREQLHGLEASVKSDDADIVRQLWSRSPSSGGKPVSETLDTLSTMDRILYLRKVPIFDDLDPEDLHQIAEIAEERSVPEGGYLCREGELEDELFLIVDGQVVITKVADGRQKVLRRLGSGQPVGELAILAQQPRSATVKVTGRDARVLVIGGKAFQAILRDRPGVASAMLANLARRLSAMV